MTLLAVDSDICPDQSGKFLDDVQTQTYAAYSLVFELSN